MNQKLDELERKWSERIAATSAPLHGGGGGGTFGPMDPRVDKLEADMKEIKADLKALLVGSAEIRGKFDGLPSAYEFGQLKGRVDSLPTLAKIGALIGFATVTIAILNNWSTLKAALVG